MAIAPYLDFDGRCEEAIDFYAQAVGATCTMKLRWKDSPDPQMCGPGNGEKIMHTRLEIGGSSVLASDGRCQGQAKFNGISLSLTAKDEADATRYFNALAEGGRVQMPLAQTFFSPSFGMVADRFGVNWMVYVEP